MRCSLCNQDGHNKRACDASTLPTRGSTIEMIKPDAYDQDMVKRQYALHKAYVLSRKESTQSMGVKVRLPSIPEDISENIVKFIIQNKRNDPTSRWDCGQGDLHSRLEGKQECKCFTSDGPLSFTPSSEWDVIYFLDARDWLDDQLVLYRIPIKRTSEEWMRIQVSKAQTFADQTRQGRRPRLTWNELHKQIAHHCTEVYRGTFDGIFAPM
jgi:hypothetical protein